MPKIADLVFPAARRPARPYLTVVCMSDISPSAAPTAAPERPLPIRVLLGVAHRWPTWLGLAVMAQNAFGLDDGRPQALIVFLAALIYLGTALLGRPAVVWPLFGACVAGVAVLRLLDAEPWPALVGGGVCVAVLALAGGVARRPPLTALQLPAMLLFGGAAVVAVSLSPVAGSYLVAAALIGHAVQDVIVWRANQVVTRSLAEFCAVLDFTLGVAILVLV